MKRRAWLVTSGTMALAGVTSGLQAASDRPTIGDLNPGSGGVGERAIVARLLCEGS